MEEKKEKTTVERGLYKNLSVSVKVLDGVITVGMIALVAVIIFAYFTA